MAYSRMSEEMFCLPGKVSGRARKSEEGADAMVASQGPLVAPAGPSLGSCGKIQLPKRKLALLARRPTT